MTTDFEITDPETEARIRELMALTGEDAETVVLRAVQHKLDLVRKEQERARQAGPPIAPR
jgi:hypothetical protein